MPSYRFSVTKIFQSGAHVKKQVPHSEEAKVQLGTNSGTPLLCPLLDCTISSIAASQAASPCQ